MLWPFHTRPQTRYWLKVFALYALVEACIQLLYNYLLNSFREERVSNLEFHAIMWACQCLFIGPIWWVAYAVYRKKVMVQVIVNLLFFLLYSFIWLGPVQDSIRFFHQLWQQASLPFSKRIETPVDSLYTFYYQLLKYAFRLSWFFIAAYFYSYRREETQRLQLAIANKELELKLMRWHLDPGFYFKAIEHLRSLAALSPVACTKPILQLAKVMEYVIYETREKLIDVSREIHFLQSYVQLLSQQPGHTARISLLSQGQFNGLKIAPLLLAGFVDKIAAADQRIPGTIYELQLQFAGNTMLFRVKGDLEKYEGDFFGEENDTLHKRFRELYPGKFSYTISPQKDFFELNMKLDAVS